jgi:hypothetical protein
MRPRHWPLEDVISVGFACAAVGRPAGSIRTGTNPGTWTPTALDTWRRHTVSSPRTPRCRRTTSDYVRAFFETLGDNLRLLLGRPPARPTLPCDQFDLAIPAVFLPGIKHGICHRSPPTISLCQAVSQAVHARARCGAHAGYQTKILIDFAACRRVHNYRPGHEGL